MKKYSWICGFQTVKISQCNLPGPVAEDAAAMLLVVAPLTAEGLPVRPREPLLCNPLFFTRALFFFYERTPRAERPSLTRKTSSTKDMPRDIETEYLTLRSCRSNSLRQSEQDPAYRSGRVNPGLQSPGKWIPQDQHIGSEAITDCNQK